MGVTYVRRDEGKYARVVDVATVELHDVSWAAIDGDRMTYPEEHHQCSNHEEQEEDSNDKTLFEVRSTFFLDVVGGEPWRLSSGIRLIA